MDLATRKLAFIEEFLHLSNEALVNKLEALLHTGKKHKRTKNRLGDFFGIMSKEDGDMFKQSIIDDCRKIDYNEWQ